ncbi:MAG: ferredoxin family protein [Prevotellaceae bacterium]|nr:ferredoxin family protein [Prevotellaceae bacterium]
MKEQLQHQHIAICACTSRSFIDKDKIVIIASMLRANGYDVTIESDLCQLFSVNSSRLSEIISGTILACYPRAVRSLSNWRGLEAVRTADIRNQTEKEILSLFDLAPDQEVVNTEKEQIWREIEALPTTESDAWFPVIDKTRCTECGKCYDFCLFGVYGITNKRTTVIHPQNCKNNCPACARVCPARAIVFPKYDKSPINGGSKDDEPFNSQEMDTMYRERLRYKLQQRRAGVPLTREEIL